MQQSTSCESAQAGTGAISAPIANTTASTFRNRNMETSCTISAIKSTPPRTHRLEKSRLKGFSHPAEAV